MSELHDQDPVALFVGKNADYYQKKWAQAAESGNPASWNFAAFFLGPCWLLYRKMFWQGGLILGAILIETMGEILLYPEMPESTSTLLSYVIGIGVAVVCAIFGNGWYKTHVDKTMQQLQSANASPEDYRAALVRQGGTSWLLALGMIVGYFIVLFLLIFLLFPE